MSDGADHLHKRRVRRVHTGSESDHAGARPPIRTSGPASAAPTAARAATPQTPGERLGVQQRTHQLRAAEESIHLRLNELATTATAVRSGLIELAGSEVAARAEQAAQGRATAAQEVQTRIARARAEHEALMSGRRRQLDDLASTLAPGVAGLAWEHVGVTQLQRAGDIGECVRVGGLPDLEDGREPAAALAPLIGHPGWYLTGSRSALDDLVLGTVCRIVAQAPLRHVSIVVFDPRFRGVLGPLAGIRRLNGGSLPPPTTDPHAFLEALARVRQTATTNAELVVSRGRSSLVDLWAASEVPEGTLNLVVVLDYPHGVDESTDLALRRCAAGGPAAGITLLVAEDESPAPSAGVDPDRLAAGLRRMRERNATWQLPDLPGGLEVTHEPGPSVEVMNAVLSVAADRHASVQGPVHPLAQVLASDLAEPWQHSSATGLELPFGVNGSDPLLISLSSENPPHPNLLVGGAVGQGKSNLLLSLIYGFAVRYSPDELELCLLDFKQGLEFKRFDADESGENWLPHVTILSLESNVTFGVAVLSHLVEEKARRAQRFAEAGVASIDAYRKEGFGTIRRLLVVIDEFHKLFDGEGDEVDEAVRLLTDLAKQGRAFGIHLLLASQTTSGLRSLATAGDGIFAQFALRMSLKNTPQESEAILSMGNKAAAQLTYRGEVILNRNFGVDPEGSNIRGVVAYAEPTSLRDIQRDLWARDRGRATPTDRPVVHLATAYAAWDPAAFDALTAAPADPRVDGLTMWLGRPISVTTEPVVHVMRADVDQTVAVVGPSQALAKAALRAMLLTALPALAGRGEIVFVHGNPRDDSGWLDEVLRAAEALDVGVRDVHGDDAVTFLRDEVPASLDSAHGLRLVVALEIQRLRGKDDPAASESEMFTHDAVTARSALADLAARGAMSGTFLIGWWTTRRALEADLGIYADGVGLFVTAELGRDDIQALAGPRQEKVTGWPRLGLFDRAADHGLRTIVPFDPASAPSTRCTP